MIPSSSVFDMRNRTGGNAVISGNVVDILAVSDARPDDHNVGFSQLGVRVGRSAFRLPCASLLARTPLGKHIVRILPLRTSKQVGRIDAFPVVAPMQDTGLVVGDVAVCKEVGNAVGCFGPPVADTDLAVPAKADTRRPFPAIIRTCFADFLPEQIDLLWGNINTHRVLLTLGATPGVVTATPRLSVLSEQLYQIGRAI